MSRSIGFVCPDLLPLLLESRVAPFRDAALRCVHLAEALHARGWRLAFLTPVPGPHAVRTIPCHLGPTCVVAAGNETDGWWQRRRTRRHLRAAIEALDVDVVVRGDGPGAVPRAVWRRLRARVVALDDLPMGLAVPEAPGDRRQGVLWVAPLQPGSGADVLLDLADAFPAQRFHVCTQPGADARYALRFEDRARGMSNVALHRDASHYDVAQFMSTARLFVSTCEGANTGARTVLAWLHGAVVVSRAHVSDELMWKRGMGLPSRDPHELFQAVQRALADDALCAELRLRARRHAEEHYDVRRAAQRCEGLVAAQRGA